MVKRFAIISRWLVAGIMGLFLFSVATPAFAASSQTPKKAYAINTVLPDNQINQNLKYWDLSLTPKQEETLRLQVVNLGSEKITVTVYANNAVTNNSAVIDYAHTTPTIYPKNAQSFVAMIKGPRKQTVTLDPSATKEVDFKIQAPAKAFDGMILGGLYTKADVTTTKTAIHQWVAYQRSVVLRGKKIDTLRPHLTFGQVVPIVQAAELALRLPTTNKPPMYAQAVTSDLTVTRRSDGKRMAQTSNESQEIAPSSKFNWELPIKKLPAGDYQMRLVVAANNLPRQTVVRNFTIEGSQVRALEDYTSPKRRNMLIIIILVVMVALLALGSWVLLYQRSKKHGAKLGRKSKH